MFKTAELGYLKDKYLYPMSLLIFILLEIVITFLMLICMYTYIDKFSNLTHVHIHIHSLAVKRARENISHQCPCNKLYFFKYRTGYDRKYIFALAQTFIKILQSISKQIRTWIVVLPII